MKLESDIAHKSSCNLVDECWLQCNSLLDERAIRLATENNVYVLADGTDIFEILIDQLILHALILFI